MSANRISRRDLLISSASTMATSAILPGVLPASAEGPAAEDVERLRRMKWWQDARFGMFIHWGLYSVLGRMSG
jgi:alpha-L-fucosidase